MRKRFAKKKNRIFPFLLIWLLLFTELPAYVSAEDGSGETEVTEVITDDPAVSGDEAVSENEGTLSENGSPEEETTVSENESFEERYGIDTDLVPYNPDLPWEDFSASPYRNENSEKIFRFLMSDMTLHKAAAVGILTNIYCESGFRPNALGDGGTSYGICQWHLGRWDNLKKWCGENGYNWETLEGQLHFLKFETDTGYPNTMAAIRKTTNDAGGAGESARLWCKNFEVPADTEKTSLKRRDMAIEIFWPEYKDDGVEIIDVPEVIGEKDEEEEEEPDEVLEEDIPEEGIPEGIWFAGVTTVSYNGSAQKPAIRVYDHKRLLKEKTDYTLSYKDNKKAGGDPEKSGSENAAAKGVPRIVVTMKGNYSGKHVVLFAITPRSVSEATVLPMSVSYTGKAQKPKPECSVDGVKLKYGKDFSVVEYAADQANGWRGSENGVVSVTLHIKGIGNYCGETETSLTYVGKKTASANALPQVQLSKVKAASIPAQKYTGEAFTAVSLNATNLLDKNGNPLKLSLTYKGKTLTDEDVEILGVENALLPGTARIRLCGRNADVSASGFSFVGEKVLTFQIKGLSVANVKVLGLQKSYTYTGEEIAPEITVEGLSAEDYSICYENNTEAGKASLIITGCGIYEGTKKVSFTIAPLSVAGDEFRVHDTDAVSLNEAGEALAVLYEKGGAKPPVRLYWRGKKLLPGRDYTLSYTNNSKPGNWDAKSAPTITVNGKGNFGGKRVLHYTITARPFKEYVRFFAGDKAESATAGNYAQKIWLADIDGTILKQGTDYSAPKYYILKEDKLVRLYEYDRPKEGDVIYVGVTGMGGYRPQTIFTCYHIIAKKKDISRANFRIYDQSYTGGAVRITAQEQFKKAVLNGKELTLGTDFRIVPGSYKANVKKGTASVTLAGMGEYGGQKVVKFKILKKK